jgi:hypothetical protein
MERGHQPMEEFTAGVTHNSHDSRYIVWNGESLRDYEDTGHDCMVSSDPELISVQEQRRLVISKGLEPVVVFACERHHVAYETSFHGRGNGVFSFYSLLALRKDRALTVGDLITRTNRLMHRNGYVQRCEVICRADLLNCVFLERGPAVKGIVWMIFDMCRTGCKAAPSPGYPLEAVKPVIADPRVLSREVRRTAGCRAKKVA